MVVEGHTGEGTADGLVAPQPELEARGSSLPVITESSAPPSITNTSYNNTLFLPQLDA